MVNDIKLLDKINLQKYIYLIEMFLSDKINASMFEEYFLSVRREDKYLMSSSFEDKVNQIMDTMFLDVDEYNPDEFYGPNDKFNINEEELRSRLSRHLALLKNLIA